MESALFGLTTFSGLQILPTHNSTIFDTTMAVIVASMHQYGKNTRMFLAAVHYYVVMSTIEMCIHKYWMHGKINGEWWDPGHKQHHLNVEHDMSLKEPIKDHDNTGEFAYIHSVIVAILATLIGMGYMKKYFHISNHNHMKIIFLAVFSNSILWNTLHNSMHEDDHTFPVIYGPPRLANTNTCKAVLGPLFTIWKNHHALHHVIKSRKTNFCTIFLGADKLFGNAPTKQEIAELRIKHPECPFLPQKNRTLADCLMNDHIHPTMGSLKWVLGNGITHMKNSIRTICSH